uniref:Uncharacterized protein n=1 Tax=Mycena chlorophos TaxID=658473 RepID=A0ABQ0LCD9_MYCCL|nr:predicted protein [Mycena chlorophos]
MGERNRNAIRGQHRELPSSNAHSDLSECGTFSSGLGWRLFELRLNSFELTVPQCAPTTHNLRTVQFIRARVGSSEPQAHFGGYLSWPTREERKREEGHQRSLHESRENIHPAPARALFE